MKSFISLNLLILILLATGCSKEQSPEQFEPESLPDPVPYYTLDVKSLPVSEYWIIIHEETGKLLDYKKIESIGKISFYGSLDTISENIRITTLDYRHESGDIHYLNTKSLIKRGAEDVFGFEEVPNENSTLERVTIDCNITNIPVNNNTGAWPANIIFTDATQKSGIRGSGRSINGYLELNVDFDKYKVYDGIITILDAYNNLKYYDEFNADGTYPVKADFLTDFKNFDHYVELVLPRNSFYLLNIAGFDEWQAFHDRYGYCLNDVIKPLNPSVTTSPLKLGYLDRFERYRTIFNISLNEGYNYGIVNYGNKLTEIVIPSKPNAKWLETTPFNFEFEANVEFAATQHYWKNSAGSQLNANYSFTSWAIDLDDENKLTLEDFPKELKTRFPKMDLDNLEFQSTVLYLWRQQVPGNSLLQSHEYIGLPYNE
ncbi:hypothetical protein DZC72_08750 [Maribacter algicola]|uniref:Uncharacterized protein n=1 Tax=Maribacter algicola TaxID=2498892 RepID=A0A3R8Q6P9_9FLAO|nr:hypothetical protein [Maribacter algicola]RRQ50606.1 hypothetical protein DZC72_08750 [Maribacter algicola]